MLVERERLRPLLEQIPLHALTLVSAAAGFGKTTLLSSWARQCGYPVAWLSLDEQDNDAVHFWVYVITALQMRIPTLGEAALKMLQLPQVPPLTTVLAALINDLMLSSEVFALVLDDYQFIDEHAIHETLQFFLTHLPSQFHLVLAGRIDPPLALSRLRAQGNIVEIRDRDLRFTRIETASFLTNATGFTLADEQVTVLTQRTEGWIAGLRLAALAMQTRADHSIFVQQLSGSQRFILDYMQEEVLDPLPANLQRFLLQSAVLDRLRADLCQAVTGEPASQQMLDTLERQNLFLEALDEERQWYRLHSLFRDVLRTRLQATQPEQIPLLHQRAAHWYAKHENVSSAIGHALAAEDYNFAATLLEASATRMWLNGESTLLHSWLRQLPDEVVLSHARLTTAAVLNLLHQTQYTVDDRRARVLALVKETMTRLERAMQRPGAIAISEKEQQFLRNRLDLLRGWIMTRDAHVQSDEKKMHQISLRMQELAREDTVVWKMIPAFNLFQSSHLQGKKIALLSTLIELRQQAEMEQQQYEEVRIMGWLGNIYWDIGHLRQMRQITIEALELLNRSEKRRAMFGYLHLKLATFHWIQDQREKALAELQMVIQFAQRCQHIDQLIQGYCKSVPVFLALNNVAEAEHALTEAEHLVQQNQWQLHRPLMTATRAQLWLAQGNLLAAANWAELTPINLLELPYARLSEYLALARVYLALHHESEALDLLKPLLKHAEEDQREWDIIHILALQAVALETSGELNQARQVVARLLQLSEAEGYPRVYLDAGEPMKRILLSLRDTMPTIPIVSLSFLTPLLAAFEREGNKHQDHEQLPPPRLALSPYEPLTAREREVLTLLAQGATNQGIADQLIVSLATAKKHVANIFLKLGATNRTQAILRAREYTLF
jgi:LuxR family maltose regulon positive regulatory protein